MTVVSIAMDMQLRKSVKPAVAALNNVINPDFIECTFVLPHCRTTGELISQLSVVCTVKIACSGFLSAASLEHFCDCRSPFSYLVFALVLLLVTLAELLQDIA